MDPSTRRQYDRQRTAGTPARHALAIARATHATEPDDLAADLADTIDTRRTVETDDYEQMPAGWSLSAAVDYARSEPDDFPGTFHAKDGPGRYDRRTYRTIERGEFAYFEPVTTPEEWRADLRRSGWPKHAAWIEARRRLADDDETATTAHSVPVTVTASRDGVELGSACQWINTSDEEPYESARATLRDALAELAPEAIEEATATLARLAATVSA